MPDAVPVSSQPDWTVCTSVRGPPETRSIPRQRCAGSAYKQFANVPLKPQVLSEGVQSSITSAVPEHQTSVFSSH